MKDVTDMTLKELDNEMGEAQVPSWPFEPWFGYPERMPAYLRLKAVVDEVVRRCGEAPREQAVAGMTWGELDDELGRLDPLCPNWPQAPHNSAVMLADHDRMVEVVREMEHRIEEQEAEKERSRLAVASIARFHEEMGMGREAR